LLPCLLLRLIKLGLNEIQDCRRVPGAETKRGLGIALGKIAGKASRGDLPDQEHSEYTKDE
jgi:hypothetical protein